MSEDEYTAFRNFLEDACGIVLGENKHYLVSSRLKSVMAENGLKSFGDLIDAVRQQSRHGLRSRIVDAMTTNETMWFRDVYPFDVLRQIIFPEYVSRRAQSLRIWSAAASTGQEPYSISISAEEFMAGKAVAFPAGISILATDISPSVVQEAKRASYDNANIMRGLSEVRRNRFFVQKNNRWEVKPEVRARVTFSELNLLDSYALLGKFDIIFCRNVLIYLSAQRKADILTRMAQALNPGGYLILGSSEAPTSYTSAFQMVRTPIGVIYRLKADESEPTSIIVSG